MLKKFSFIVGILLLLIILSYASVFAADQTIDGKLTVTGDIVADGTSVFINKNHLQLGGVDYPGVDPTIDLHSGDSQLKDMTDLYVLTNDYIHLGPTTYDIGKVLIQTKEEISGLTREATGTIVAGTINLDTIRANTAGSLFIAQTTIFNNDIKFNNTFGNSITLGTQPNTDNYSLRFPINSGIIGEFLQTDGLGNLSWSTPIGTTYTAGDGLDLIGNEFSIKINGSDLSVGPSGLSFNNSAGYITATSSDAITNKSGDITMWNTGILPDLQLSSNITKQGNNFNSINQLVQLDASGFLPALNASALTNLSSSQIGLGYVENVALSTWAGSINIDTLGIISTGVWNASTIPISKGGTGQTTQTSAFNALSPLISTGDLLYFDGTNNVSLNVGTDGDILSVSGGIPTWIANTASISNLTFATSSNTIDNTNYAQNWNWSLTSNNQAGILFGESSPSIAGGISTIVKASTLAGSTALPLYIKNLGDGASFRVDDESADTSLFLIDNSGNVAIGSDFFDPSYPEKLKVDAQDTNNINVIAAYGNVNGPMNVTVKNRNAGTDAMTFIALESDNGDFSINTVALGMTSSNFAGAALLPIAGPNESFMVTVGNSMILGTDDTAADIKFITGTGRTVDNERMRIDELGNVGINTTTPGSELDVKGTIRFSGSTSGFVGIKAAPIAGATTYTLPSSDGSSGYALATNGSGQLYWTNAIPPFQRTGTIISPVNSGDDVTTSGDIYTSGTGTITSAGLLSSNLGLAVTGADINLNNNDNFITNINTGTSTGSINIGNSVAGAVNIVSGDSITVTADDSSTFSTSSGTLTVTSATAATWGTSVGDLSLQVAGSGTTAYVQIGNGGVGSTSPDIFVLDVKSDAGDPIAGTDGAMYYNESTNKFRCHTNGSWLDCDTTGGTVTLQSAYNNGSTITTHTNTDIVFTLTDGDFNITGSDAVNISPTSASQFTSDESLTLTGGSTSVWGTTSGDLILQVAGVSSSANVQIGAGGAGSATPDLFALDVKSTTGDPLSGYNGAMYYNEADGVFRCYENGGWKNCGQSAATATTLEQAYNAGNIITTNGDNISFILSSGGFTVSGTDSINLTPTGASSFTSAGALTLTAGDSSTWGTTSGDLTLQAAGISTTANIQIGVGGAGSANPDLFALDVKSTSGDPTGFDGAMYYNAFMGEFRCYEDGEWMDCDGASYHSLQYSYDGGASITTNSNTSIDFNLASGDFNVTGVGAVNLTPTSSSQFTSGGALTIIAGTSSTWGTTSGDLNFQVAGTSTTANIQIGAGGAGSTTPDLFVLDVKSSIDDPAGTNGAMYYNGGLNKLRCYENGIWKNCDAGIPESLGMAKGDLIAYSSNGVATRLPVGGTTGWVLTVDPTQTTGMKWAATPSAPVTSVFGRTGEILANSNDYTWAQIDKTISSLADITTRSAGDINTGTLNDARLSVNVTTQGNVFNNANQLVQLDSSSFLPVVNGSQLTGLTNTQVGLGNVENIALSTWVGSTNLSTLGTITTGTWNAGTISASRGGTGISSYAAGDMLYASGTSNLSKLPVGTNGQVLTLVGGLPAWQTASGLTNPMTTLGDIIYGGVSGVPTRLAGSAGFLKSTGSAAPTWSSISLATDVTGTLSIANGGTGMASVGTAGNVLTSNGSTWTSSAPVSSGDSVNAYDTTTPVALTSGSWTDVTFSNTTLTGWTYSTGGFTAATTGTYLITYYGSYSRTSGSGIASMRLTKNGTEIPGSIIAIQFQSNNIAVANNNSMIITVVAGEVIKIQNYANATNIQRYVPDSTPSLENSAFVTITRIK